MGKKNAMGPLEELWKLKSLVEYFHSKTASLQPGDAS